MSGPTAPSRGRRRRPPGKIQAAYTLSALTILLLRNAETAKSHLITVEAVPVNGRDDRPCNTLRHA
jgi:hypothetical protein